MDILSTTRLLSQCVNYRQTLDAILSIGDSLASAPLQLRNIPELLAERSQELIRAEGVTVDLLAEDDFLETGAASGSARVLLGRRSALVDYELSPESIHYTDFNAAPLGVKTAAQIVKAKSLVQVPLNCGEHTFGVLTAFSQDSLFGNEEVTILQLLGTYVAPTMYWAMEWAHDRNEKQRCEEALKESEKLALLGREAAMISHEIKNPVDALGNLLYLLENHSSLDEAASCYVKDAQSQLEQIRDVSSHTLGFSKESSEAVPVKVSDALEAVLHLYRRKIQYKKVQIERHLTFSQEIWSYPGELRQILSNLVVNALEAVSRDSGKLTVHTFPSRHWISAKLGVRIVVSDNGPGILPQHRAKVFQPFFTTKEGKGSGLGLWVTHEIIKKHGGAIRLRSRTEPRCSGTIFSIFLPLKPQLSVQDKRKDSMASVSNRIFDIRSN